MRPFAKPLQSLAAGCALAAVLLAPAMGLAQATDAERLARQAALAQRLDNLEAIKAVEKLQFTYGYYQDRFLYDQVATLFADKDPEVHWLGGVWTGHAGLKRLWLGYARRVYAGGAKGPVAGRLFDLPQWQGVVTVAPDGMTAKGRFRTMGKIAVYRRSEYWISGVYENDYVKEDGVWKIKVMRFCSPWSAVYTDGWQNADAKTLTAQWSPAPNADEHPDRVEGAGCADQYPHAGVMAFHFANPVTGQAFSGAGGSQ